MSAEYEVGYAKAKLETEIKYWEELAALKDIKAEYDRAFVMCREAGVTRERTKRLSVAVYILINQKEKENGKQN